MAVTTEADASGEMRDAACEMRPELRRLWQFLTDNAVGHEHAIVVSAVAAFCGVNEREVRQWARELVIVHRKPIGSSTGKHAGLYVIVTADERDRALRQLDNRLRETYARRRALSKTTAEELVEQGLFDFARSET